RHRAIEALPADRLLLPWMRFAGPCHDAKEVQADGGVGVNENTSDPGKREAYVDPQLFVQLARERALRTLCVLHLAARIPTIPRRPSPRGVAQAGMRRRRARLSRPRLRAHSPPGPVAGELIGDAPAARAALQRPLQRFLARRLHVLLRAAERLEPVRDDLQVLVLVER